MTDTPRRLRDEAGNEYEIVPGEYDTGRGEMVVRPVVAAPVRWRAEPGDTFWYVDPDGQINNYDDDYEDFANGAYNVGNYFQTIKQAMAASDAIRATLSAIHTTAQDADEDIPWQSDVMQKITAAHTAIYGPGGDV